MLFGVLGLFPWKKKKTDSAAPGSTAPFGQGAPGMAPTPQKTQAEKMKEWMDYERMYGRPHPEAPGWVTPGGAAANAPKPKCPVDEITINYEPFTGQYFCSKCGQRYTAEQVFRKEDELLEHSRPAEGTGTASAEESEKLPAGEKLELSSAPPSWSTEHGESVHTGPEASEPAAAPLQAPPAPAPPKATPMEASPVTSNEPVLEASPVVPEGINPAAGKLFNMPAPIDYSELPPPAPAKESPKLDEEQK